MACSHFHTPFSSKTTSRMNQLEEQTYYSMKSYETNGFFIKENVFTKTECKDVIDEAHEIAQDPNFSPLMMPHRVSTIFDLALKKKPIVDIVEKLVSGQPEGLQSEFFFGKPGTKGFSAHQDNYFVEAPYGAFVSAWCPLTDTYPSKGGLIIYPGSHKEKVLEVEAGVMERDAGQDPNANTTRTLIPKKYSPLNVDVPQGAVLFIHGNLIHASNDNKTNEFRTVLLNTYIRSGCPFRSGRHAKRALTPLF